MIGYRPVAAVFASVCRLPAWPARRARSTTGPIARATAATSASVDVCPS
jgi:hypothetical protein